MTVVRVMILELRVMMREPMVIIGLLGIPILFMIVIAGVFGNTPDPDFGGVAPDDYYIASYLGVALASLGLVALPVHIATNRELGVTRRFRASGLSSGQLVAAQFVIGIVLGLVSTGLLLAIGSLLYDMGLPQSWFGVIGWYLGGLLCFIAIGGALGALAPTGRAATAIGNMLFMPAFLLGGGGPPRGVMTETMQSVTDVIPLSHITAGLRQEWLGATDSHIIWWLPLAVCLTAVAFALAVTRRRAV